MNNQNNINKIIVQLEELWDALPNAIPAEQTIRQDFRTKLEALEQTELKELEALGKLGDTFLQEKSNWLTKEAQLEKAKKDAEEALVAEKKKLSEDLVSKLEALAKGKDGELSEEAKAEFKKMTEALTTKTEVSFTEADTKKLATELKKEAPTNYWAIGACVFAGLAAVIATASLIFKSKEAK